MNTLFKPGAKVYPFPDDTPMVNHCLSIDGSTGTVTSHVGVAVLRFPADPYDTSKPELITYASFAGSDPERTRKADDSLWMRLRSLHRQIGNWVSELSVTVDLLAVEQSTTRGRFATRAMDQAYGAILCHPAFGALVPMEMHSKSAKKITTGNGLASKEEVQTWMRREHPEFPIDDLFGESVEAICDATAIGYIAIDNYQAAERVRLAKLAAKASRKRSK